MGLQTASLPSLVVIMHYLEAKKINIKIERKPGNS